MSQNDLVVANASGATVRADINSALQAQASKQGGTSAPATTYPNQDWFDTTNDTWWIRDEANTAWVKLGTLVGSVWTPWINGVAQGNMSTLVYTAIAQDLIMSAKQLQTAKATVASATTPNLSTAAGNAIELTGTTTITGFTTGQAGSLYFVEYTGAGLTLTHNATSLICPTAASIAVATGDSFFVYCRGSNNVRIIGYQRASGAPLGGGSAASQAEMEAASSLLVNATPGRTQYHPGVLKSVHTFDGTGTPATLTSLNITSLTDGGTGDYTSTIATDYSTSGWSMNGSNVTTTANNTSGQYTLMDTAAGIAAGSVIVNTGNASGSKVDVGYVSIQGAGDQ